MSPQSAITAFLRNTFTFSGRASRAEYWWPVLGYYVVIFALALLAPVLDFSEDTTSSIVAVIALVLVVPFVSAAVRRLHDIDRPWTHLFVFFIPVVGPIILLVWLASRGDTDFNRFGPPGTY